MKLTDIERTFNVCISRNKGVRAFALNGWRCKVSEVDPDGARVVATRGDERAEAYCTSTDDVARLTRP